MRKLSLAIVLFILPVVVVIPPAAAATCPALAPRPMVQFAQYSATTDLPLVVSNPGVFSLTDMPGCAWNYQQPLDLATGLPAGTISAIQNSTATLGTTGQGGFTFTSSTGYTGTALFWVVSLENEFVPQYIMITVSPGSGGSGGVAQTKADCKGDGWKTHTRADGSAFKNQGDCVNYVTTGN